MRPKARGESVATLGLHAAGAELVAEAVGLELIEPLAPGFAVDVHEVRQLGRFYRRAGQRDVVRHVVRKPVHLPATEQALTRRFHLCILDWQVAGGLFEDDLAHVRRIYRDPAETLRVELRAAMLSLADDRCADAEAAVTMDRRRDPEPVDVARRNAGRAAKADEHRIQVAALAAEVLRLQHRLDVAPAAAARFRIAERVLHDPLVNRTRLVEVGTRALDDVARGFAHDAVGRDEL